MPEDFCYSDFTEINYCKLIKLAKSRYEFISYDYISDARDYTILLRHDVDFSLHRAMKLATIEVENNIVSTYFLHLHSNFYNLLEEEIFNIVKSIIKLGHKIGLHFDPSFYKLEIHEDEKLKRFLCLEKSLLENLFDVNVNVFSFHNPDIGGWTAFENYSVCGMINTYSKYLKENFTYCSDSNGYWRHKRLEDILLSNETRLHVLTHPEWWVPNEMSPRNRVHRCIDGRSDKCKYWYDTILKEMGRENVR